MSFLRNGIIVVVLVLIVRGFIFEPFRIPSQSMLPTLLVGDHIWVKRYAYGLRVPGTKSWLAEFSDPQRGDVVVFRYPNYEKDTRYKGADFIKRIVGVPGDQVLYEKDELTINGEKVKLVASEHHEIPFYGEVGRVYMKTKRGLLVCCKDKCLWIKHGVFSNSGKNIWQDINRYDKLATVGGAALRILEG